MNKLLKAAGVIVANIVITYVVLVSMVLLIFMVQGEDPSEGGLLIAMSPLGMLVFVGAFFALVFGLVNGTIINVLRIWLRSSDVISLRAIGLSSAAFAAVITVIVMLDGASGRSPYYIPVTFAFLFTLFFLSNLATVYLTKRLFSS